MPNHSRFARQLVRRDGTVKPEFSAMDVANYTAFCATTDLANSHAFQLILTVPVVNGALLVGFANVTHEYVVMSSSTFMTFSLAYIAGSFAGWMLNTFLRPFLLKLEGLASSHRKIQRANELRNCTVRPRNEEKAFRKENPEYHPIKRYRDFIASAPLKVRNWWLTLGFVGLLGFVFSIDSAMSQVMPVVESFLSSF